ncbi:NADH dehydrogenase [ubiquinone] complex I, assembly factor 7 [Grifola frondosa]|uniref:Protein arginine methyltransferase NDUFAF7 n=1 Tax=Grifola frondosa TaxID=5627 RepID=A0A1C7MAS3_GRIFR|nr:NADH dehydrogenase [ubiquinone] complex I, assembly factor 7 [Grifola frondosa]
MRWCLSAPATARRGYANSAEYSPTKVEKILSDSIKATGPISFATYMQMCLSHPTDGYYMNPSNPILGSRGDFITSPEISQVFGEHLRRSRRIRLVELGPGRGTLMEDVLRVLSQFPAARSVVEDIHLVETSAAMQSAQGAKLFPMVRKNGWNLTWHSSVDDIRQDAEKYTLILAHEFFDALPFHLLQKTNHGWQEVLITLGFDPTSPTVIKASAGAPATASPDFSSTAQPASLRPQFRRVLAPSPTAYSKILGMSSNRFQNLPIGAQIEISPAAFKIARKIGELVHESSGTMEAGSSGSALIIDYGGEKAYGSSFRAFKDHKIVDVFHRPGDCDLTVNVDFTYLKEATADLAMPHGPLPQATFLRRMGIETRVNALKSAAKSDERRRAMELAGNRLVDPTGMGTQYQVMGLTGLRKSEPTAEERWPFVALEGLPGA